MWEGSSVGTGATLRALVTVDTYARVEDDEYIPRGTFVTLRHVGHTSGLEPPSPASGASSVDRHPWQKV